MTNIPPALLSDSDLLAATTSAAADERSATARLLILLAEVDARQLFLTLGDDCTSLFAYATRRLHLSESAAYSRITAARRVREFPMLLPLLDDGALSLTAVGLLSPHLTEENHAALFEAARHKSKREVERLVAVLHPQPDIASSVRALPAARTRVAPVAPVAPTAALDSGSPLVAPAAEPLSALPCEQPRRPALVAPLAPGRYLIRMTVSEEAHQKLQRARDLLRHAVPDGDPAAIFERALTVLLQEAERRKTGAVERPRFSKSGIEAGRADSRHVPAAVRRTVWARDESRCAFVGSEGRCVETGGLEFHHVAPFASGGPTTVENLQLRCRAHNAFESRQLFGDWRHRTRAKREVSGTDSVRTESGVSDTQT